MCFILLNTIASLSPLLLSLFSSLFSSLPPSSSFLFSVGIWACPLALWAIKIYRAMYIRNLPADVSEENGNYGFYIMMVMLLLDEGENESCAKARQKRPPEHRKGSRTRIMQF